MRQSVIHLLIVAAVLAVSTAQAEKLYKWVGKDGTVSYQDKPPSADVGTVQEKELASSSKKSAVSGDAADPALKFPVVIYTVPKCDSCNMVRTYLKKRHIPFAEKNVDNNLALQKEMKEKLGDITVPTITIGSKIMKGYLESLLEGELDQAGYPKAGKEEGEQANQENVPPQDNATP